MTKKTAKKIQAKPKKASPPKKGPVAFVSTGFWLMKSEPESYSVDQWQKDGKTLWTGVRNYQARNFMMTSMKPGERIIFYHSNAEPSAAVGSGEITRINLPDPSALDAGSDYFDAKASSDHPIWFCAEVKFQSKFKKPITLAEIRVNKKLANMALLRPGQRLSILPLSKEEFESLVELGRG